MAAGEEERRNKNRKNIKKQVIYQLVAYLLE